MEDEPDYLPPGPRAEPRETEVLDEWRKAEAGQAARLAHVAGRVTAMRQLDDIEAWAARAEAEMTLLSGRTPPALRAVLTEWPLVSTPMAEALTGASRAAVQRNLAWMQERALIREVTGQGRFRMWKATS